MENDYEKLYKEAIVQMAVLKDQLDRRTKALTDTQEVNKSLKTENKTLIRKRVEAEQALASFKVGSRIHEDRNKKLGTLISQIYQFFREETSIGYAIQAIVRDEASKLAYENRGQRNSDSEDDD